MKEIKGQSMKPEYTKVDDETIRITLKRIDEVPLVRVIQNLKMLEKQRGEMVRQRDETLKQMNAQVDEIEAAIAHVKEVIANAEKLGIKAKLPEAPKGANNGSNPNKNTKETK